MLKPPQPPTPPARVMAPHVQAALGRSAQARMPERVPLPVRQPAAHVQAAMQRVAQPKPAVAPPPRRVIPPPPVRPPRLTPSAVLSSRTGTIQRMEEELPENIVGMNRDGETVKTAGGTWKAIRYVAVKRLTHAPAWGASMTLEFTPEYPADATKIALVQTVTAFKNGDFFYLDETTRKRSYAGTSIDQHSTSRSPLYADDRDTGNGTLGSSSEEENSGQHGYRYWDSQQNRWMVKAARLRDTPHFRGVTSFSSQTFETTALAVAGNDKGTYYGSVRWGWRLKQEDGDVLLDPLTLESRGSASDSFVASATQWNKTKTSDGQTPQQLPPVAPRHVNVVPVNRTRPNPTFTAIRNEDL